MESWWIDELAHAGREHLDDEYVAGYEKKAGFDPVPDIELLVEHGMNAESTVIDFGAATGVFAIAASSICRRVIAVDVSPAMVAVLQHRIEELEIENVDVVRAGLLSYEHEGDPVDVVYSRNTFHQIPDFWKRVALARIAAVCRAGTLLRLRDLVYDFEPKEAATIFTEWMGGAVADKTVGFTSEEFAEHVRMEHSTYGWIFEAMIERTGFTLLEKSYRRSVYGSYLGQYDGA